MHEVLTFLTRLYTQQPWIYLSWPAAAMVLGTFLVTVWPAAAQRLGIVPRTGSGTVGVVASPFLHANAAHLLANLPPFVGLGYLVLRRDEAHFPEIAGTIALATDLLVWLAARKAAHVGMSGVIFGFLGYLVAVAWFTRTTPDLLVGGGVLLFYGGMLAGVAPVRGSTSWESHLFGLLAGLARAWWDLG
ncbi:MAG TPA: rhomboid family intramembrane serine protease [Opitutaceae bacterium]|nr:rhomboid family intramembrane serine protease [Opitutaceae bacterium]